MSLGLLLGLYAFDGPFPAPPYQGQYNGFFRRLTRLGHAYCIVLGLLAILVAQVSASRLAAGLLVAGSCLTLLDIGLVAGWPEATPVLGAGPLLIALALLAAWGAGTNGGTKFDHCKATENERRGLSPPERPPG